MLPGEGTEKVAGSDKANVAEHCQSTAIDTIVFFLMRLNFSSHKSTRFSVEGT